VEDYTYIRADGIEERAHSAVEAIRRCPVLGSMPVEQANVLLDLAAIGQSVEDERARQQTEAITKDEASKQQPREQKADDSHFIPLISKDLDWQSLHVQNSSTDEQHQRVTMPDQIASVDSVHTAEAHKKPLEIVPKLATQERTPVPLPVKTLLKEPSLAVPEYLWSATPIAASRRSAEPELLRSKQEPNTTPEQMAISQDYALSEPYSSEETSTGTVLSFEQTGTMPWEDQEQVEQASALAESIEVSVTEQDTSAPSGEWLEPLIYDSIRYADDETLQLTSEPTFEMMVLDKSSVEPMQSLERLAAAAEQPLEIMLVQLAHYFAEAPSLSLNETSDETEHVVQAILKDLDEALQTYPKSELRESYYRFPAEVTKQLTLLLTTLGYEDPQLTVEMFCKEYSIEFLRQSIRYLYQLIDGQNRQEFLLTTAGALFIDPDEESLVLRLGRALNELFSGKDLMLTRL
jgi:hypothetical protein